MQVTLFYTLLNEGQSYSMNMTETVTSKHFLQCPIKLNNNNEDCYQADVFTIVLHYYLFIY